MIDQTGGHSAAVSVQCKHEKEERDRCDSCELPPIVLKPFETFFRLVVARFFQANCPVDVVAIHDYTE